MQKETLPKPGQPDEGFAKKSKFVWNINIKLLASPIYDLFEYQQRIM